MVFAAPGAGLVTGKQETSVVEEERKV